MSCKTNWLQNFAGLYIKNAEETNTPGWAECHIHLKTCTDYAWFLFNSRQRLCFFSQPSLKACKTTASNFPTWSIKPWVTNAIPVDTSFNQSLWYLFKKIKRRAWVSERGCRCEEGAVLFGSLPLSNFVIHLPLSFLISHPCAVVWLETGLQECEECKQSFIVQKDRSVKEMCALSQDCSSLLHCYDKVLEQKTLHDKHNPKPD